MNMLNKITPLVIICSDTTLVSLTIDSHTTYFLPEYNLSPKEQRQWARNCVSKVNSGQHCLVITHSDYIIKEFNILIMLNVQNKVIKHIQEVEGYLDNELLDYIKVTAYDLCNGELKLADISPEYGIEVKSMDESIQAINRIVDVIVWRDEDE
jgi:broad-specificity NMP kinase